jgi:catechol 2,3-dioxygenase-like lactoylglutathione lyase family enzyme
MFRLRCGSGFSRDPVRAMSQRLSRLKPLPQRLGRCLALGGLLFLAASAVAQDVLIRGAEVHTVAEQGKLAGADVLVRDGKIAAVGTGLTAPAGVAVIDAKGRPLTPGLFGGIGGLGIEEVSLEPATVDSTLAFGAQQPPADAQWRPEFDVTLAFNPRSTLVPVARVEGLTWSVIAPGSVPGGSFVAGQGGAVTLDGRYDADLEGSRTLFVRLGSGMVPLSGGSRAAQWMLLDQAVRESRTPAAAAATPLLTPTGREALARYLGGGRVAFYVDRAADIRRTIAYARTHGMRPVIVGGVEAWIVAGELARANVPVLIDALANLPGDFDQLGAGLDSAAKLHAAGVRIAFSQAGDASHNARKIRQHAGNAVAHGLPWDAALAALTANPAEIFGLAAARGRIAPGLAADLVMWSGDPLEVTTFADQVWIAGRALDMRSRQTELRDRYLERAGISSR